MCVRGTERDFMSLATETIEIQDQSDEFYIEKNTNVQFYFLFYTYSVSTQVVD